MVILNLRFPSQIKEDEGLETGEYMTAVRLFSENYSISVVQQQSARTCAATGEHSSQNTRKVNWNEMFFFKVESVVCKHNTFWNTFTPLGLDIHGNCSLLLLVVTSQEPCFHLTNISFSPQIFQGNYTLELLVLDAGKGS